MSYTITRTTGPRKWHVVLGAGLFCAFETKKRATAACAFANAPGPATYRSLLAVMSADDAIFVAFLRGVDPRTCGACPATGLPVCVWTPV